jgi:membrane fusion protein (multidrug efflux system)
MFEGRITGFTMGTGSTLALLPPENATGNFIKVVQRLPVRIEPVNYDPDKDPLFIGLSVVPHVYIYEPATGPDAGKVLQPYLELPTAPQRGPKSALSDAIKNGAATAGEPVTTPATPPDISHPDDAKAKGQ